MRSTLSLPSLTGPLRPGVVAPDTVLSMVQIERNCDFESLLFLTFKLPRYVKLNSLN